LRAKNDLARLACFTSLTELSLLGKCNVSDVRALAGFKPLTKLVLKGVCEELNDAAFSSLASLTNLTTLSLLDCTYLSENGLKTLFYFPALAALSLEGTKINDDVLLGTVARLTDLTHLDLSRTVYSSYSSIDFGRDLCSFAVSYNGLLRLGGILSTTKIKATNRRTAPQTRSINTFDDPRQIGTKWSF
jgi:hypothetical protein